MSFVPVTSSRSTTAAAHGGAAAGAPRLRFSHATPDTSAFLNTLSQAARDSLAARAKQRSREAHGGASDRQPQGTARPADNGPANASNTASSAPDGAVVAGEDDASPKTQRADSSDQPVHQKDDKNAAIDEVAQSQAASVTVTLQPASQPVDGESPEAAVPQAQPDKNVVTAQGKSGDAVPVRTAPNQDQDAQEEGEDARQAPKKQLASAQTKNAPSHDVLQGSDKAKHAKSHAKAEEQSADAVDDLTEALAQAAPEAPAAPAGGEASASVKASTLAAPDSPRPPGAETPNVVAATATHVALSEPAEVAPPAQEPPAAHAPDPLDQVVLGLKSKLDARTGKAEIRLDPPNLGAVKVSLTLESGNLTAQFESSSEMVRDLLKSHLGKLKTVLEGQGVSVDRLAVESPAETQSQGQGAAFGSATHDGRSAGQYFQDSRSSRHAEEPDGFASLFREAQEAPLDLVA